MAIAINLSLATNPLDLAYPPLWSDCTLYHSVRLNLSPAPANNLARSSLSALHRFFTYSLTALTFLSNSLHENPRDRCKATTSQRSWRGGLIRGETQHCDFSLLLQHMFLHAMFNRTARFLAAVHYYRRCEPRRWVWRRTHIALCGYSD